MEPSLNKFLSTPNSFLPSEYECEICEDSGSVFDTYHDDFSGQDLECMKPCSCLEPKRASFILGQMPGLYRNADLNDIQPWEHKHKKQAAILTEVKKNPFSSYLFLGASGVGKSYISWALWKNAALAGRRAVATTAVELLKEFRDLEIQDEAKRPKVLPSDLAQSQFLYTIFIDEIEKVRVSPFSMEKLFELIKNAVDYGHQLIVTTNMREAELRAAWSKSSKSVKTFEKFDTVWGEAIMRRLVENTTVVEMWR